MNELSNANTSTTVKKLNLLKEQMNAFKADFEGILQNYEKESPKIIIENLSLILSLLLNCISHIDLELTQNKLRKFRIKKIKRKTIKSDTKPKVKDKNDVSEELLDVNIDEFVQKKSKTENYFDDIKEDIEENITAENLDDPIFQHEEMAAPTDIELVKNEIIEYEENDIEPDDSVLENLPSKSAKVYSCDICNRKWQSLEALLHHKKTFDHEAVKCQECDRHFPYPKDLKRHTLKHSNEKPWCCDLCGKTFRSEWNVKFHKERVHGDKTKDIPCKICDKTFAFEDLLKAHIRNMHKQEKSWACEQCGKTFKLKQALLRHMVTHTDERPFKCDICEKLFKSARDLTAHQRTHSAIKLYECEECDVSLTHQSSMVRHYRTVHKMIKTVKTKQPVFTLDTAASVPDSSLS